MDPVNNTHLSASVCEHEPWTHSDSYRTNILDEMSQHFSAAFVTTNSL